MSDFKSWVQVQHSKKKLPSPENIRKGLLIDETSLSNSELCTILTNKAAKGKKVP